MAPHTSCYFGHPASALRVSLRLFVIAPGDVVEPLDFMVRLDTACATSPPQGRADLLGFFQDGQTTRADTYLHLGEPAGLYEDGRIMSFRLGQDDGGYFPVGKASGFTGVKFSLIMVFNETGILARHALVQVKAP